MPKYYCEYCGIYLTHSSPSGRKQHSKGRKHISSKVEYYSQFLNETTATKNANPFIRGDGFPLLMGMLPGMGGGPMGINVPGIAPSNINLQMMGNMPGQNPGQGGQPGPFGPGGMPGMMQMGQPGIMLPGLMAGGIGGGMPGMKPGQGPMPNMIPGMGMMPGMMPGLMPGNANQLLPGQGGPMPGQFQGQGPIQGQQPQ